MNKPWRKCPICQARRLGLRRLSNHLLVSHSQQGPLLGWFQVQCWCGEYFTTPSAFRQHLHHEPIRQHIAAGQLCGGSLKYDPEPK